MDKITDAGNALPEIGSEFHPEKRALLDQLRSLAIRNQNLLRSFLAIDGHICQTLGAALHYPRYCDDPENFPDATEADGVCTGEHVAESLAREAAATITALEELLEAAREARARPRLDVGPVLALVVGVDLWFR